MTAALIRGPSSAEPAVVITRAGRHQDPRLACQVLSSLPAPPLSRPLLVLFRARRILRPRVLGGLDRLQSPAAHGHVSAFQPYSTDRAKAHGENTPQRAFVFFLFFSSVGPAPVLVSACVGFFPDLRIYLLSRVYGFTEKPLVFMHIKTYK